ncbi:MAG: hypothetical protein PWP03_801 [Candidatus Woesearchaeota archaeon]|nr:hypothetical protein [Candidatus Woesearchaeota archaeon]MDN5328163.1 hypothetical protein [Candidatus Woesearchaeota archaeon]
MSLNFSALEKIVESYKDLKRGYGKLVKEVDELNLQWPVKKKRKIMYEKYSLSGFDFSFKESVVKINPKISAYKLSKAYERNYSINPDDEIIKKNNKALDDFFRMDDDLVLEYNDFKSLKNPNNFSSKKEYVEEFSKAVDFLFDINKKYNSLRNEHVLFGKDFHYKIKLNFKELYEKVSKYNTFLEHRIKELEAYESTKGQKSKNVSQVIKSLHYEKGKAKEFLKTYDAINNKMGLLITELSQGLDILDPDLKLSKRHIKSLAKLIFELGTL